ncbi:MAG: hypothetical protein AAF539_02320 [Planctomycetota bacterium]
MTATSVLPSQSTPSWGLNTTGAKDFISTLTSRRTGLDVRHDETRTISGQANCGQGGSQTFFGFELRQQ